MVKKKSSKKSGGSNINWIIGWLVGLFVLFLALSAVFDNVGKFDYNGLTFIQEKFGEIDVYHYSYYYAAKGGGVNLYNMFLRVDPRENEIPIGGDISLGSKSKFIYLSISGDELVQCEDSALALAGLSSFLSNNEFLIKSASWNAVEAEKNNIPFVGCQNRPDHTVIKVEKSDVSEIIIDHNCFIIKTTCEDILKATEKFQVQTILSADRDEFL